MKKILIISLLLISSLAYGQNDVNRTLPVGNNPATPATYNKQAVVDNNLKVRLNLSIPRAATFTLNNARDTAGYIMYNTTIARMGIYKGPGLGWDTLSVTSGSALVNYYTKTASDARFVPLARTITINGTSQDLSINRTWTVTASTPNGLTAGYGISGSIFDGGIARTWVADTASASGLVSKPRLTATLGSYVPKATTVTINGTTQDLSLNRTYNVGTVTSIGGTAGTGISITGSPITTSGTLVVTNTAPDQTVVLNNGTGISNTGTYPNFTVTNTLPDRTVVLTSGTGISATGTYPNFTITNTLPAVVGIQDSLNKKANRTFDNVASGAIANVKLANSTISGIALGSNLASLSAGTGISLTDYNGSTARTVTNSAPDQTVSLTAGTGISTSGTYPNFTITNTSPSSGGTVTSVTGTANQITVTGTTTPVISLPTTITGLTSVTSTGFTGALTGNATTVTTNANLTGVVTSTGNATAIADAALSIAKTSGLQTALDTKLTKSGDIITGDIGNTSIGFFQIPSGTTAQRPATPLDGMRRYNTTTLRDEFYANGSWQNHARLAGDTFTGTVTAPAFVGGTSGGTEYNSPSLYLRANPSSVNIPLQISGDNSGRILRFHTSDYNNSTTGSSLRINFGAATGNTSTSIEAKTAGETLSGTLTLNPNGGNVNIGTGNVGIRTTNSGAYNIELSGSTNISGALSATGTVTAPTFIGALTGNASTATTAGNITGIVAIANGGTGQTTAPLARTALGGTTIGQNLFTQTNPSAITFPRYNADNTVSALDAATFRTAIGAGTGSGTVSSVTGTANQITVTGTSTPVISLPATITGLTSVTSTGFTGALTGNASTATTAGTVTTAAQPAITSVGTLTGITTSGGYTQSGTTANTFTGALNGTQGLFANTSVGLSGSFISNYTASAANNNITTFARQGGAVAAAVQYDDALGVIALRTTTGHSLVLGSNNGTALTITPSQNLTISVTPTTSAGTADILTRNTSTGVVEKVAYASGVYTPTFTNVTNTASFTGANAHYTRTGNEVFVQGRIAVTTTVGASTSTSFTMTLPVSSGLTISSDVTGAGVSTSSLAINGEIVAEPIGDTAQLTFLSSTLGSIVLVFNFMYTVK